MSTGKSPEEVRGLRALPSVDLVLKTAAAREFAAVCGSDYAAKFAREAVERLRSELANGISPDRTRDELTAAAEDILADAIRTERRSGVGRVINATGVIVHTNLGRAPLSEAAVRAIEEASGYCAVEFDAVSGKRGRRGARAERLAAELTGAEEAIIVNNCAAAAVLVLTSLCEGGEAVISRGELVEIGGDFRVPDVMKRSGADLVEVGTTNRTKLADYGNAISERTRMILKVHPSNYRIVGFTSVPSVAELAELAHSKGVLLFEDAGSGALEDLSAYGLSDEPVIRESVAAGADVVTFSGDKLLGSVQSGFIVGRAEVLAKVRKHPLYRAFRPGKIVYAALEATLEAFLRGTQTEEVPVMRMLAADRKVLEERTSALIGEMRGRLGEDCPAELSAAEADSVVGGGSAPAAHPTGPVVTVRHRELGPNEIESRLRAFDPPVVARIENDAVVIDLRTVPEKDEAELVEALATALG